MALSLVSDTAASIAVAGGAGQRRPMLMAFTSRLELCYHPRFRYHDINLENQDERQHRSRHRQQL